jgi:hypothetical protein
MGPTGEFGDLPQDLAKAQAFTLQMLSLCTLPNCGSIFPGHGDIRKSNVTASGFVIDWEFLGDESPRPSCLEPTS